jgi:hypothetical protein
LNEAGELIYLATACDMTTYGLLDENAFTKDFSGTSESWASIRLYHGYFSSRFRVASGTTADAGSSYYIQVPADITDESMFTVKQFSGDGGVDGTLCEIFNITKEGAIRPSSYIVVYGNAAADAMVYSDPVGVVDKVTQSFNDEGEPVYKLYYYGVTGDSDSANAQVAEVLDMDMKGVFSDWGYPEGYDNGTATTDSDFPLRDVKQGDVLQMTLDAKNRLLIFRMLWRPDIDSNYWEKSLGSITATMTFSHLFTAFGVVVENSSSDMITMNATGAGDNRLLNRIFGFIPTGKRGFFLYDRSGRGEVRSIQKSDVLPGDKMFAVTNYFLTNNFFIIR